MNNSEPTTCVVGSGIAGLRASTAILKAHSAASIVIVGQETYPTYSRPGLSKTIHSADDLELETMKRTLAVRSPEAGSLCWKLGSEVMGADLDRNQLQLASGGTFSYDCLVIATGVRARAPRIGNSACIHHRHRTLRTLDDAHSIHSDFRDAESVTVLGSGFIACELATLAVGYGCKVVMLDSLRGGPFESLVGSEVSGALRKWITRHGVSYLTGDDANEVRCRSHEEGPRTFATTRAPSFASRRSLYIEAIGSIPNTEWLHGNPIDLTDGVLVDRYMRIPKYDNVFAAGDIARYPDPWSPGTCTRLEFWKNAIETGGVAGRAVARYLGYPAESTPIDYLPNASTNILGLRLQIAGNPRVADSISVVHGNLREPDNGLLVSFSRQQVLVGVVYMERGALLHRQFIDLARSLSH